MANFGLKGITHTSGNGKQLMSHADAKDRLVLLQSLCLGGKESDGKLALDDNLSRPCCETNLAQMVDRRRSHLRIARAVAVEQTIVLLLRNVVVPRHDLRREEVAGVTGLLRFGGAKLPPRTLTRAPRSTNWRMMLSLMPQSTARMSTSAFGLAYTAGDLREACWGVRRIYGRMRG